MAPRIWVATGLVFAVLIIASALLQGWSNDHEIHPVLWYTLVVLGEVSNIAGMGRTMAGAVYTGLSVIAVAIAFALFLLLVPAKRQALVD